ncbi:MAG: hypothetical protein AB7K73_03500 [Gammaproteobacteria bacterium]
MKTLIARLMIAIKLGCACVVAQAQLISNFPEFIENHLRTEATNTQDNPKLHTQFKYDANGTLITSYLANLNNDGFDDHMALGMTQGFSNTNARVSYNVHRFDYSSWESQTSNITFDLKYRTLLMQHRLNDTAAASTIYLPFESVVPHLDLSYTKTRQKDSADTIDEFRVASRFNQLKYSATWTNSAADTATNFSAEFRPSGCCLMMHTYTLYGDNLRRQFRSEYSTTGLRFACEYMSEATQGRKNHISSAIVIEKDINLAAINLRLEHNEFVAAPAIYFNLESRIGF